MKAKPEKQSAPIYQTSPRHGPIDARFWDATIGALLRGGNSFLPLRFSEEGYLFRGLRSGIRELLESRCAGHFSAEHSLGSLEKKLGVYFVSNTPSDALSVAGLERDCADAGIVVFPAPVFNDALAHGRAGVLAYAEGGLVFKYPFLCQAPTLQIATHLLINGEGRKRIEANTRMKTVRVGLERCGVELLVLGSTPSTGRARQASAGRLKLPPGIPGARFERSLLRPFPVPFDKAPRSKGIP